MKEQDLQSLLDWMVKQPEQVQRVMAQFPPGATVRGKVPLMCPAPGRTAEVKAYRERFNLQDVTVCVVDGDLNAECEPGWIEVVEFRDGFTPEAVLAICGLTPDSPPP